MGNVLLTVLTAVLTAGIVKTLGTGTVFDKYLRYLCALLLTLGLLSPLKTLLETEVPFSDLFPQESVEDEQVPEYFLRNFEYEIEKTVAQILENEFSLDQAQCQAVAMAVDEGGTPKLSRVTVTVHTLRGAALTGKIRKNLEQALGCEIVIREEIG